MIEQNPLRDTNSEVIRLSNLLVIKDQLLGNRNMMVAALRLAVNDAIEETLKGNSLKALKTLQEARDALK